MLERKFLACADCYDADVVILGGDVTGKALVPIVHLGDDRYLTVLQDQRAVVVTEDELGELHIGSRLIQRSRGISLSKVQSEIPVE